MSGRDDNGTLAPDSKSLRARSNVQTLHASIVASESGGRFRLEFSITGTEHVPVAIELAFRHGGMLEGVEPAPEVKDGFLLRSGKGRYVSGGDAIEFDPGRAEHTYTGDRHLAAGRFHRLCSGSPTSGPLTSCRRGVSMLHV